jgi:hypothetical protein
VAKHCYRATACFHSSTMGSPINPLSQAGDNAESSNCTSMRYVICNKLSLLCRLAASYYRYCLAIGRRKYSINENEWGMIMRVAQESWIPRIRRQYTLNGWFLLCQPFKAVSPVSNAMDINRFAHIA